MEKEHGMNGIRGFLAAAVLIMMSMALNAATLSTNYAEVFVENLKLGGSYNLSEVANFPMWINYNGDTPVDLDLSVIEPLQGELKSGYEPIPDVSWVSLSKTSLTLLPDESARVDVTLNIPNDEKYLNKKYQVYVRTVSMAQNQKKGGVAVALALKGRILFEIAPKPPTEAEVRELKRKSMIASQGVIVTPEKFTVPFEPGAGTINVTQDVPLKLINSSREKYEVTIEAVEPEPEGIAVPRTYAKGDAKEVSISKKRLSLAPDEIANVGINITVKAKEVEKLFYLLKLRIKSKTMDVSKLVKIYIEK